MANALRIKCILSLTARWHRCLDASAISRLRHSLPPPSFRLDTSSFLVRRRRKFRLPFSENERIFFAMRPLLQLKPECSVASFQIKQ